MQSSCSVLELGTCGRARALLLDSVPRLPPVPVPGYEGTGSSRGRSPACTEMHYPHQGLRRGLATRRVWPGTEEVTAALVGALGELRQFSIGWFLKRPKPAKPDVPEARQAGRRVWSHSGFALSCHLDLACTKMGTDPACASPVLSITSTTATRNLQPNTGNVKKGFGDILGEVQAPDSSVGVGRGWRSCGSSLHPVSHHSDRSAACQVGAPLRQ